MPLLATILGGNVGQLFRDVVGTFKLSPEKKAELQQHIADNQAALDAKQLDLEAKAQDAVDQEVKSAAAVIMAEAQSQSWLPRNVRPFLLLLWGIAITFNLAVPIVARLWRPEIIPLALDPWVYKLTAIGFTGYVSARTVEKMFDKN